LIEHLRRREGCDLGTRHRRGDQAANEEVGAAELIRVRALDEANAEVLEPRDRRIGSDQHEHGVVAVALLRAVAERDRDGV
jgi:hypothetical protein